MCCDFYIRYDCFPSLTRKEPNGEQWDIYCLGLIFLLQFHLAFALESSSFFSFYLKSYVLHSRWFCVTQLLRLCLNVEFKDPRVCL